MTTYEHYIGPIYIYIHLQIDIALEASHGRLWFQFRDRCGRQPLGHQMTSGGGITHEAWGLTKPGSPTSSSKYPLVNIQKTMENHHVQWENPLFPWWFSIAMLVYQRVSGKLLWRMTEISRNEVKWVIYSHDYDHLLHILPWCLFIIVILKICSANNANCPEQMLATAVFFGICMDLFDLF